MGFKDIQGQVGTPGISKVKVELHGYQGSRWVLRMPGVLGQGGVQGFPGSMLVSGISRVKVGPGISRVKVPWLSRVKVGLRDIQGW